MITVPAAAQENIIINFNSGDLSIAGNIPLNDELSRETTMSLLNIGIEGRGTNIGMEFTPFKFFSWTESYKEDGEITAYSLANFIFYWNILNLEFIYFGPFTSINYLFVEDRINWNKFIFTAGLQIGFRASLDRLNYRVVSIELGYRNIDRRSKYYMGAKVDLAVGVVSFFYLIFANASSKNDN